MGDQQVGDQQVGDQQESQQAGDDRFEAEIRWTTHGVAHITAGDLGGLGFGQGWACARDHLATICDQVTKVRSERARFFGAGDGDRHLHSDLGYLALGVRERGRRMATEQPAAVRAVVTGYAAGLSAWLAEHGTGAVAPWARDAAWVRPPSTEDLFTMYADLALMASGRNLAEYIGSAAPPGSPRPPSPTAPLDAGLGSNGWALGRDATATGRGMMVANPHFPWYGEGRFWECHLRIPGDLDVYGASLVGTPFVQIGLNQHVAWTHTFSRGHRFTVYKLDLEGGSSTTYRYGDELREMTPTTFEVQVAMADGDDGAESATATETETVERTLWSTHYGPVVDLPFLGWSEQWAFTYRDANLENDRFFGQVLAVNRADSVDALREAVRTHEGLPWVNTIAADDQGRCWYADSSATPNLTPDAQAAFVADVDANPITNLLFENRVALLDGSDPAFEWVEHPDAASPGLVPFDELPQLERTDHVFNANDPYWLPHAEVQLDEHQVLCGLYHRTVSPRTRMNALILSGEGPVAPSGPDGRFTPDDLEQALLGNHSLLAELLLDGVLDRCRDVGSVTVDGREVELGPAVVVLDGWDRRFDVDSVGAVLWREFLGSFPDDALRDAGALFEHAYDPASPVHTPRGLAPAPTEGPDPVLVALGRAVRAMEQAGIALEAALGEVQYVERAGRRIPLHGANEIEGIANVVAPMGSLSRSDLEPFAEPGPAIAGRTERTGIREGGYQTVYGVSFIMIAWFTDEGPRARCLLAYGQSGDPTSPHHVDQVEAFSRKELREACLTEDEIAADPELEVRVVTG